MASSDFTVRESLRHINSFRNRFAHVPFPYDEMSDLAEAFAEVTEQLFSLDPKPWQTFPDARVESPLNGSIEYLSRRLRGKLEPQLSQAPPQVPRFVFPAVKKDDSLIEEWDGRPFLYFDSMLRPSILTRLISESNGVWEYTRFFAERNSVVRSARPEHLSLLAAPAAADYPLPIEEEEPQTDVVEQPGDARRPQPPITTPENAFERALRQIANEEYEPAIAFLSTLVEQKPEYHIGWLRLGHAERELAMRKQFDDRTETLRLFGASIEALSVATRHAHVPRRAQALYERSKAYFHRARQVERYPQEVWK